MAAEEGVLKARPGLARRAHLIVLFALQAIMAVQLVALVMEGRWQHVILVAAVMAAIAAPELLRDRLPVQVPSEIQIAAVLFIFATLFLGEVRDYYERIWWWDLALHTSAGLMFGLIGFLVVYFLNESGRYEVQLRAGFVALFAFAFAVALGNLWEIFEFSMDRLFGLTMQKPMADDPSGLTDTMWDTIVNAIGAAIVSVCGWLYIRQARRRHVDTWIARMLRNNRRWRQRERS